MKKNFLSMMKRSMVAICTVVAAGMISASLSACSSSEDESEKNAAKVKEYLAGNEWTINSTRGTYSYYKNHLVYYEEGGGLTPGGYVIEPNTAFGYWQMDGDRLTTRFEVGTPKSFNIKNLLNETISGVHLQENNKLSGSGVSISIDMRPLIVGTFANGNECQMRCGKTMNDLSDETDHDVALRGTWYCVITITKDGKKKKDCMGAMTFSEDGTMHMVIEGVSDHTATYTTKNGKVTINGFLTKNDVVTFYYTNLNGVEIKLYSCKNGYLSSIWFKNREDAEQY